MKVMQQPKLHPIEAFELQARRERIFLDLAGFFLGIRAILNIPGISRFMALLSFVIAIFYTIPFYICNHWMKVNLRFDPVTETDLYKKVTARATGGQSPTGGC